MELIAALLSLSPESPGYKIIKKDDDLYLLIYGKGARTYNESSFSGNIWTLDACGNIIQYGKGTVSRD